MRPQSIISSGLVLVATTAAWPNILVHPADTIKRELGPYLAARQDDTEPTKTSFNLSYTPPATATSKDDNASATSENNNKSSATSDSSAQSSNKSNQSNQSGASKTTSKPDPSGTGTHASSGKSKGSGTTTSKPEYDPRHPAGGVSMITPNPLSPASYYKIHDYITFAWNYTSLSSNPSYIDVYATCTKNQASYSISSNMTFEQTQAVTWDTGAYQATGTVPLLTETYTLVIHDAQLDVTATVGAGYFGAVKSFTFGMYSPQPYTPIADYVCATCSAGVSTIERQTYGFIFGMVGVTLLSFGWFGGVAGLW